MKTHRLFFNGDDYYLDREIIASKTISASSLTLKICQRIQGSVDGPYEPIMLYQDHLSKFLSFCRLGIANAIEFPWVYGEK